MGENVRPVHAAMQVRYLVHCSAAEWPNLIALWQLIGAEGFCALGQGGLVFAQPILQAGLEILGELLSAVYGRVVKHLHSSLTQQ